MPRKQKPPGFEKWTWEEIRCGRKLSKGEKRVRRIAKGFGATEKKDGNLEHTPESFFVILMLFLVSVLCFVVGQCSEM